MVKNERLKKSIVSESTDFNTNIDFIMEASKKMFRLKDTGITPNLFQNWKNNGLIPIESEERTWVRLNFYEYLWLKVIGKMRTIGCSLETIVKAKKYLYEPAPNVPLATIKGQAIEIMRARGADESAIQLILSILAGTGENDILKRFNKNRTRFSQLIETCVLTNQRAGIIIPENGLPTEWLDEFLRYGPEATTVWNNTHVFISVSTIIEEFIQTKSNAKFVSLLQLPSSQELVILQAIRQKDFKQIKIIPLKDGGVDVITVKDGALSKKEAKKIAEILKLRNYQNIVLKKSNGETISFEREHRKRL